LFRSVLPSFHDQGIGLQKERLMESLLDELFAKIVEARSISLPATPLENSPILSKALGCEVLLKCEHLQPTGSFKIRGATNKIRLMGGSERRRGVMTASTGNHGKAVAHAARAAGVAATVYVAAGAAPCKLEGIRALGAELVVVDGSPLEAELQARKAAATQGQTYISPYNDAEVMAGQGTLGLELLEQEPGLDAVFISVGGGGLIGGTGTALKALCPQINVVGVWPSNSPCMLRALEAGKIIQVEEQPTLSDGTAGAIEPGSLTFPICEAVIDDTVEVSEAEIAAAMWRVAEADHWMVEGAAGVALAGLIQRADAYRDKKVAVVLCGRNIDSEMYLSAMKVTAI
jgi:threonine dehydratase